MIGPWIGRQFSNYQLVGRLGAGGMGEVYRARDLRLNRDVAIKVLAHAADGDEQAARRLMREARAAAALDHPNICTVYEVGEVDGHPYIAMQLVQGESLAARLARGCWHSTRPSPWAVRSLRRSLKPIDAASFTATSSRRTSC